jgi:tRNA modification GTPase
MSDDTITAIATSAGRGGIGIVRISGERAIPIASAIFKPVGARRIPEGFGEADRSDLSGLASHRLHLGHIIDCRNDRIIDEVLLSLMRAPASYTREDVVEINTHGGPLAMQSILKLVIAQGARLAEPGEFTRRAFLNGRIDLTQAEAVADLINARSQKALRAAAAQLDGRLQEKIEAVRQAVIALLTRLEAGIDFPEDVEGLSDPASLVQPVRRHILEPVRQLIRSYDEAHVLREGLQIAVVGKPNVGKSSLLNQMVQKDRAIVTDIPGTTRDVVTESLNLYGVPVTLSDTAGVQRSRNPVEMIGIQKTIEQVERSDLVLFLVEAHQPPDEADASIFDQIGHRPHLVVFNKMDLVNGNPPDSALTGGMKQSPHLAISALTGEGIDDLKKAILEFSGGETPIDLNPVVIPNLRHKKLLDDASAAAEALCSDLEVGAAPELLAVLAGEILQLTEEILGVSVKADILEQVFEQFCIGK